MTRPQEKTLNGRWWPAIAKRHGLDRNDRQERLDALGSLVGRRITTTKTLRNSDLHKIKAAYKLAIDPDNITASIQFDHPEEKEREVHLYAIEALAKEICRLHALTDQRPDLPDAWLRYLRAIVRGLTSWTTGKHLDLPTATQATLTESDPAWFAATVNRADRPCGDLRNLRNILSNNLRAYLRKIDAGKLPNTLAEVAIYADPKYRTARKKRDCSLHLTKYIALTTGRARPTPDKERSRPGPAPDKGQGTPPPPAPTPSLTTTH
jgi:hypothetical protein